MDVWKLKVWDQIHSILVNKVLLENSQIHSFTCSLLLLLRYSSRAAMETVWPAKLNILLPSPLQNSLLTYIVKYFSVLHMVAVPFVEMICSLLYLRTIFYFYSLLSSLGLNISTFWFFKMKLEKVVPPINFFVLIYTFIHKYTHNLRP